jgi:hypothetical protein
VIGFVTRSAAPRAANTTLPLSSLPTDPTRADLARSRDRAQAALGGVAEASAIALTDGSTAGYPRLRSRIEFWPTTRSRSEPYTGHERMELVARTGKEYGPAQLEDGLRPDSSLVKTKVDTPLLPMAFACTR